jgi:hypothetical protein
MTEGQLFSRSTIDRILSVIPAEARCCYTGQSILAYCPDPTFDWAEVNSWPDQTDVDIFAYNKVALASLVQLFLDNGYEPVSSIDAWKAERIRFWEAPRKFSLQTVALIKENTPAVNLTWYVGCEDVVSVVKRFDMDYLCVGMDIRTRQFIDLRGPDHRVAGVNTLNAKFDVDDVDVSFWLRQFDRVPKGWLRGIDTRPVAQTYLGWIESVLTRGDRTAGSKTSYYADRQMETAIAQVVEAGFTHDQAVGLYKLFRQEDNGWGSMRFRLESSRKTIIDWLKSVED